MTLQRRSRGDRAWMQAGNTLTQEQYVPARRREFFPCADASFLLAGRRLEAGDEGERDNAEPRRRGGTERGQARARVSALRTRIAGQ